MLLGLIRLRIPNTDTDPGRQINADPDLQHRKIV
jgi:hypothetical protein